jgi:hypothetical protein
VTQPDDEKVFGAEELEAVVRGVLEFALEVKTSPDFCLYFKGGQEGERLAEWELGVNMEDNVIDRGKGGGVWLSMVSQCGWHTDHPC